MEVLGLRIAGKWYDIRAIPLDAGEECLVQWLLISEADEHYTVAMHNDGVASCDCADHEFRRRQLDWAGCKHIKAIRSLRLLGMSWTGEPKMVSRLPRGGMD
jgi:hypothetical protein